MGNLSQLSPEETPTIQAIYDWHVEIDKVREGPHHGRLGASVIGKPCERELWYIFRQLTVRSFSGRILRLFKTGHLEEERFAEELRGIGCQFYPVDPETGEQYEYLTLGGHFCSHLDGMVLGLPEAPKTWHVTEMKTMGGTETQLSKDYDKVVANGVKEAKPEHYCQCQVGMGMSGLKRAAYFCKKKATDHIHMERIYYDAKCWGQLYQRAERVIRAAEPLERISDRSDSFACRFCDAFQLCWGTSKVAVPLPSKSCRSCCHATPEIDKDETWARWSCAKHSCDRSLDEQRQGCDQHLLLPGLVSFAVPNDAGDGWIEFKNKSDGAIWRHGNEAGMWSTEELMRTPGPLVGEKSIEMVKEAFGSTVTELDLGRELTLIEKYPPEDSHKLWDGAVGDWDSMPSDSKTMLGIAEQTGHYEDDAHYAWEYNGRYLLVVYKDHNHAAIWEGKE